MWQPENQPISQTTNRLLKLVNHEHAKEYKQQEK